MERSLINTTSVAQALVDLWRSDLAKLQVAYCEAEFAAMVAFVLIQNGLWPLWISVSAALGNPVSNALRSFRLMDDLVYEQPWICLTNPITADVACIIVHGSNLPSLSIVLPQLLKRDMCMTLAEVTPNGLIVNMYGEANQVLEQWGLYDPESEPADPFNEAIIFARTFSRSGGTRKILIPVLDCAQIITYITNWFRFVLISYELIRNFQVHIYDSHGTKASAREVFVNLAAKIWEELLLKNIICCGGIEKEKRSLRNVFTKRDRAVLFRGICLLQGDYSLLWQKFSELQTEVIGEKVAQR